MELIKKNVHMHRQKSSAVSQITLEEDYNIPDSKPDVGRIILDKGEIKISEVKPSEDFVIVKGQLIFKVLYLSDMLEKSLHSIQNAIPFEEMVRVEGINPGDSVCLRWDIEDLSVTIINSRKLSIQTILTLMLSIEELYDEETPVEIHSADPIEYCKDSMDIVGMAVMKKDILRIKQELDIPSNMPNIFDIMWDSITAGVSDIKLMDQKISVSGELHVFLLYEAEGDDKRMQWFEKTIPYTESVDCSGCSNTMIPDIEISVAQKDIEIKPDYDGEQRVVNIDMVLDLNIKLYEEEKVDMVADVYSVSKEVETETEQGVYQNLLLRNNLKCRVNDRIRIKNSQARILQICNSEANVKLDEVTLADNGINVDGIVEVRILYVTADDNMPFYSVKGTIPFSQNIDVPGIDSTCLYFVKPSVEQISTAMIDSEEIEVKVLVGLQVFVLKGMTRDKITDIHLKDIDLEKMQEMPGMIGYIVAPGETLWKIGKKYYVPIQQLIDLNDLNSSEVKPGDKLLIVKAMDIMI